MSRVIPWLNLFCLVVLCAGCPTSNPDVHLQLDAPAAGDQPPPITIDAGPSPKPPPPSPPTPPSPPSSPPPAAGPTPPTEAPFPETPSTGAPPTEPPPAEASLAIHTLIATLQGQSSITNILPTEYYDVSKYGAIPDDGQNDAAKIQSVLLEAMKASELTPTVKNPIVYLPPGVYDIEQPLDLTLPSKGYNADYVVRIVGDWPILRARSSTEAPLPAVLRMDTSQYISLERVVIDANQQALHGMQFVKFGGGRAARMERVIVMNAIDDGLVWTATTGPVARGILAYGNGGHGWLLAGANATQCDQCAAMRNRMDGFHLTSYPGFSGGLDLTDLISVENGRHGINAVKPPNESFDSVSVRYGTILDNSGDGIRVGSRNTLVRDTTIRAATAQPLDGTAAVALQIPLYSVANYLHHNIIKAPTDDPAYATIRVHPASALNVTEANVHQDGSPIATVTTSSATNVEEATSTAAVGNAPLIDAPWDATLYKQILDHLSDAVEIPSSTVLSITDFGAVPHDGKDDTAAIRSAIMKALTTPGHPIVYIPRGRYEIYHPIILDAASLKPIAPLHVESDWAQLVAIYAPAINLKPPMAILILKNFSTPVEMHRLLLEANHIASYAIVLSNNTGETYLNRVNAFNATIHGYAASNVKGLVLDSPVAWQNGGDAFHFSNVRGLSCLHCEGIDSPNGHSFVIDRALEGEIIVTGYWAERCHDAVSLTGQPTDTGVVRFISGWFEVNSGDAFRIDMPHVTIDGVRIQGKPKTIGTRAFRLMNNATDVRLEGNRVAEAGVVKYGTILIAPKIPPPSLEANAHLANTIPLAVEIGL